MSNKKPDPDKLKEWFEGQIKVELKKQDRLLKKQIKGDS
ncbi:hypothetical protein LCGC14_0223110 [marine sediment metagenome]|uniref:Uncharacterized protein n=1 Tax=marine sediment metagenome TaxID=412755 RepID=A0A0F9XFU2_9ZZZZ